MYSNQWSRQELDDSPWIPITRLPKKRFYFGFRTVPNNKASEFIYEARAAKKKQYLNSYTSDEKQNTTISLQNTKSLFLYFISVNSVLVSVCVREMRLLPEHNATTGQNVELNHQQIHKFGSHTYRLAIVQYLEFQIIPLWQLKYKVQYQWNDRN